MVDGDALVLLRKRRFEGIEEMYHFHHVVLLDWRYNDFVSGYSVVLFYWHRLACEAGWYIYHDCLRHLALKILSLRRSMSFGHDQVVANGYARLDDYRITLILSALCDVCSVWRGLVQSIGATHDHAALQSERKSRIQR